MGSTELGNNAAITAKADANSAAIVAQIAVTTATMATVLHRGATAIVVKGAGTGAGTGAGAGTGVGTSVGTSAGTGISAGMGMGIATGMGMM